MPLKKKATSKRVQVNGKAGSGRTTNMSGLANPDEQLREVGINPKINFTGTKKRSTIKKTTPKRKVVKKKVIKRKK